MSTEILDKILDFGIAGVALYLMYRLYDKTIDVISAFKVSLEKNTQVLSELAMKIEDL